MAARAARASLGRTAEVVRASRVGERAAHRADVVVVDQTLADPPSHARLTALARRAPGAPILSVVADGAGTYRWLRVRSAGTLFQIEAIGSGTLEAAVAEATAGTVGR